MQISLFSNWVDLASGLVVGILFGFLLRKGYVTRFSTIVNQLLLKDFTVMKIMLTAIASGGTLIYSLRFIHPELELSISLTTLLTSLIGGAIFGIGMALMGYCPGTGVAALADGAKDMWYGLLGMVVGAGLYAELSTWIQDALKPTSQLVKTTLPDYFNASPFTFLAIIWVGVILLISTDWKFKENQR